MLQNLKPRQFVLLVSGFTQMCSYVMLKYTVRVRAELTSLLMLFSESHVTLHGEHRFFLCVFTKHWYQHHQDTEDGHK